MPEAKECLCCAEIPRVANVTMEVPEIDCITEHPGFSPICLNEYVLRVAYYQYKQRYGHRNEQGNE